MADERALASEEPNRMESLGASLEGLGGEEVVDGKVFWKGDKAWQRSAQGARANESRHWDLAPLRGNGVVSVH